MWCALPNYLLGNLSHFSAGIKFSAGISHSAIDMHENYDFNRQNSVGSYLSAELLVRADLVNGP